MRGSTVRRQRDGYSSTCSLLWLSLRKGRIQERVQSGPGARETAREAARPPRGRRSLRACAGGRWAGRIREAAAELGISAATVKRWRRRVGQQTPPRDRLTFAPKQERFWLGSAARAWLRKHLFVDPGGADYAGCVAATATEGARGAGVRRTSFGRARSPPVLRVSVARSIQVDAIPHRPTPEAPLRQKRCRPAMQQARSCFPQIAATPARSASGRYRSKPSRTSPPSKSQTMILLSCCQRFSRGVPHGGC